MKKIVKFKKLNKDAIIPDYAHTGDAGMDLYSIQDDIIEPLLAKCNISYKKQSITPLIY